MRKGASGLLTSALAVFLLGSAQPSQAQSFLGNYCWQFDGFSDTLLASVTAYPGANYGITVRWRAAGSYQFVGSGAIAPDPSTPGTYLMGFSSAGTTGNHSCDVQASLDTATLAGPVSVQCPSTGFLFAGTLSRVSPCPSDAAPGGEEGMGPTMPAIQE